MPRIVVTGHASRQLPAERGTVRIALALIGDRREDVLAGATRLHVLVAGLAKAQVAQGAATWWSAGNVIAAAREEWVKPKPNVDAVKVVRFWAGADLQVKFRDFGALADWSTQVAQHEGVSIGSVAWTLTEPNRAAAVEEVRTAAAEDAVVRAGAYARALGLGPVRLVTLYEAGLRPHVGATGGVGQSRRLGASPGSAGGIELRPEDVEVATTVTADFDADLL